MGIPIFGQEVPLLGDEPKKRAEKCLEQIQQILKRYNCALIPVITIAGTKIVAAMDVVAKPPKIPKIPGRTDN
jgi:hypothetical protein